MWKKFLSTKFIFTALSLGAVFLLAGLGKDVRQLEIVVPAILGFYMAGNVGQSAVNNKYGIKENGTDNGNDSNNGR